MMNINDHKLALGLALLSTAAAAFLPYTHISAGLAGAIMGFLGTATTIIKTYSAPPEAKP